MEDNKNIGSETVDLGYASPKYENIPGTPHSVKPEGAAVYKAKSTAEVLRPELEAPKATYSGAGYIDPNATRITAPHVYEESNLGGYKAKDSIGSGSSGTYGYGNSAGKSGAMILGFEGKKFAAMISIMVVLCLLSSLLGGIVGSGLRGGNDSSTQKMNINTSNDITTTEAVAKKALSSVVGITSKGKQSGGYDFFGFGVGEEESTGVGTGMIIDKQGHILTNSHVVMDGDVSEIKVLLSDGSEVAGNILWYDASIDLAIVKIDPVDGLNPIDLGDSDEVEIGSYVAAIGNPLGLTFSGSITQGVISGLNRNITASDGNKSTNMEGLMQVDAAINSGNSGGPLLNSKGQVIGINTAKASAEGMGFAIPINTAKPIIDKVIKNGAFERVYMGISATDASTAAKNYANADPAVDKGAFITDVTVGSPAEVAGLKPKDIITELDGKAITSSSDLIKRLLNYGSGDIVKIKYNRDGTEKETEVKLMSQSEMSNKG